MRVEYLGRRILFYTLNTTVTLFVFEIYEQLCRSLTLVLTLVMALILSQFSYIYSHAITLSVYCVDRV